MSKHHIKALAFHIIAPIKSNKLFIHIYSQSYLHNNIKLRYKHDGGVVKLVVRNGSHVELITKN